MSKCQLRLACEADLAAINDIFNHYVVHTTSTYTLEPISREQRQAWFADRPEIHPVTVVELDGRVVAWGALGSFRPLAGYRNTVENSVYVHPDFTHQGLGSLILASMYLPMSGHIESILLQSMSGGTKTLVCREFGKCANMRDSTSWETVPGLDVLT